MLRDEWKTIWNTGVNTRSLDGREAYDKRVLAFVRGHNGDFIPARTVQEAVGGTAHQVRKALNRLIENGLVTYQGRARGTRYASL
jgi:hypothetical protein